ncbi:hypothetical protein Taro_029927 [Colocasia esculenta]|uniref:Nudix hydrolase domain-containing protein n=1 Tax=Colocasia esculenta TaxID=4460 RepID=A0A843VUP4_COLES|nr:hypothetical protein [Colocasia esculenta]
MSEEARTGRHRQRYDDDNARLVAGCIPYRLKESGDYTTNLEEKLEVLMISSPNRDDLVFPKGGWELDETLQEAACREAYEEAGIRGIIHGKRLGPWVSRSKSSESSCSLEGSCRCYMYALEVTEEFDSWPEQASHERRWLPVPEARSLCRYKWMEEALGEFLECQDAAISTSSSSFYGKPSESERISGTTLPIVVGRECNCASMLDPISV